MNTTFAKFVRLTCVTMAFVAVLSIVPFSQAQDAHASAAISDPMVLVAVDVTSPGCQIHQTRTRGATSITTSTPCLPGTAMQTEQVPLSQARAHHWSYLALSSATRQQITMLMQTQRQALRAHLALASGTQERKAMSPNYTCGWNTSRSLNNVLNGDTISVTVYYYVASNCSTIILGYSQTVLVSPYYNPVYWQDSLYDLALWGYCQFHYCYWGDFQQTMAPPNTVYQENYNATEDAGLDYMQEFSENISRYPTGGAWWQIDLGNIS